MERDDFGASAFIQGHHPQRSEPLSRYLPLIGDGIISSWLKNNIPPGSWILDPFCGSPKIALEAARAGYRVLVTVNNPITRFLLEMMANPPSEDEFTAAFSALSASYLGDERLEPHILSLYNTICAQCGQGVSADAFLWEHGNPSPYMREYTCPNCGDSGEHPCTAFDVENASKLSSSAIHKARAIERVVASNDQDRIHVESAVSVYNPRALYALITIINKIGGLNVSPSGRKSLFALLLFAFDQTNAMWKVTGQKEKPRQLTIPRAYRENNVWLAMEEGINFWIDTGNDKDHPLPLLEWPTDLPPSGGISIFEGRFNSIADSLRDIPFKAVCTSLPRPNQAYWTLSALWAGWLWGRQAISGYKSVLHRQRYDWAWHTSALSSVFNQLALTLIPSTPIFGLINDVEPGFIASALLSASLSGCHLSNIAIREEEDQAQVVWKSNKTNVISLLESEHTAAAVASAKAYLKLKGEPSRYLTTLSSMLIGITNLWAPGGLKEKAGPEKRNNNSTETNPVDLSPGISPSSAYSTVLNTVRDALSYRYGFTQYGYKEIDNFELPGKSPIIQESLFPLNNQEISEQIGETEGADNAVEHPIPSTEKERPPRSSDILTSALFWLREVELPPTPRISDRYEQLFVSYLTEHPGVTFDEIDQYLCQEYTGLFTPPIEFVHLCMESYAYRNPADPLHWSLRTEDKPSERQADIELAVKTLLAIGKRLNLNGEIMNINQMDKYIAWYDASGNLQNQFYTFTTAAIGDIVLQNPMPTTKAYLIIPGSRANIVFYKFRRDPRLSKAFSVETGNWRFLKFRHLRGLADTPVVDSENLEQLLNLDPLTYSAPQLWLI